MEPKPTETPLATVSSSTEKLTSRGRRQQKENSETNSTTTQSVASPEPRRSTRGSKPGTPNSSQDSQGSQGIISHKKQSHFKIVRKRIHII